MTKDKATQLFAALDKYEAWSQEEYEKGVKEAEEEGEEPMDNPRVFDIRLDATSDTNGARDYRVRVTGTEWTARANWQALLHLCEDHEIDYPMIQNNGIELS